MQERNIQIDDSIEAGWDLTKAVRLTTLVAEHGERLDIDLPGLYVGINNKSWNIYAYNERSCNEIIPYIAIDGDLHFCVNTPYFGWEQEIENYTDVEDIVKDYITLQHDMTDINEAMEYSNISEDIEYIRNILDNDKLAYIKKVMQEYKNKYGEE